MGGGEDGCSFGPGPNINIRAKLATSMPQGQRRQAAPWRRRALPKEGEARESGLWATHRSYTSPEPNGTRAPS